MYMLYFHVPETHIEQVKHAIFTAGAGRIGNYSHCVWQTLGEGQFKPLSGSNPFIGETDKVEKVVEYKIETVCSAECIKEVVAALIEAHPYESPSYQIIRCETHF